MLRVIENEPLKPTRGEVTTFFTPRRLPTSSGVFRGALRDSIVRTQLLTQVLALLKDATTYKKPMVSVDGKHKFPLETEFCIYIYYKQSIYIYPLPIP